MTQVATIRDVLEGLTSRWAKHPSIAVCNALADYVAQIGLENAKYLSLGRLSKAAGKDRVDEELLTALNILSVNSPPLLCIAATLHYGEQDFDLDADEVDEILSSNTVVHPITGELIEEASDHTEIYYTVSEAISEVD